VQVVRAFAKATGALDLEVEYQILTGDKGRSLAFFDRSSARRPRRRRHRAWDEVGEHPRIHGGTIDHEDPSNHLLPA
jgi:hypothetical protein